MCRARRRKGGFYRESWLGNWLRRNRNIREGYCQKCGQKFMETPLPKPEEQVVHGSSAALIYPGKRWGRKEFIVQVGRWRTSGQKMYLSQLLEDQDLDDLAKAAAKAQQYIDAQSNKSVRSRR